MNTKRHRGFSLIEMMAVVFLVAIAFSMVTFLFSDKDRERALMKGIERLAILSQHAAEMATVDGEAYGLLVEPPEWREDPFTQGWRYRWQRLSLGGWVDVDIEAEEFPPEVHLDIFIEDQLWEYDEELVALVPIIGFFPGGDVTPFSIEISHRELDTDVQHIELNEWSEIVWREKAEAQAEAEELADVRY